MAFKSFSQYQEDKNGDFFVLPNDGDYADVVFLYRSPDDVLVGDVHYIMSKTYNGYAHCCGANCPACNYRGQNGGRIKIDHKIFIPLYNITKGKIEFWDRTTYFEQSLQKNVFSKFPNPSEAVFRITRHGEARSRDTYYDINPIARNSAMPYEKILADFGVSLPEGYDAVCKEFSVAELDAILNDTGAPSNLDDYGYVPVPRGTNAGSSAANFAVPQTPNVPIPNYGSAPVSLPAESVTPVEPSLSSESSSLPEYAAGMPVNMEPVAILATTDSIPAPIGDGEVAQDSDSDLDDVQF
jgi:hypothetical protein